MQKAFSIAVARKRFAQMAPEGNLFGTASEGGNSNCLEGCGVVFDATKKGSEQVL